MNLNPPTVHEAATFATTIGANHTTSTEAAENVANQIADNVKELGADLIIVSGNERRQGNSVFLGHTIDNTLRQTTTTTIVAIQPSQNPPGHGRSDSGANAATESDDGTLAPSGIAVS